MIFIFGGTGPLYNYEGTTHFPHPQTQGISPQHMLLNDAITMEAMPENVNFRFRRSQLYSNVCSTCALSVLSKVQRHWSPSRGRPTSLPRLVTMSRLKRRQLNFWPSNKDRRSPYALPTNMLKYRKWPVTDLAKLTHWSDLDAYSAQKSLIKDPISKHLAHL